MKPDSMVRLIILYIVFLAYPPSGVLGSETLKNHSLSDFPEIFTKEPLQYNQDYYISVDQAMTKYKTAKVFLVDVRSQSNFDQFHIQGSLNIPLYAVKTKSFLKTKPIILINEGHHYGLIENQIAELRESGFNITILWGGLHFWHIRSGPVEGDIFEANSQDMVSPVTYFHERNYANWIILDTSPNPDDHDSYFTTTLYHMPYSDNPNFLVSFKTLYRQNREGLHLFLIINEDGTGYANIKRDLSTIGIQDVFYLENGLQGYQKVIADQIRIYERDETSKKTIGKCNRCQ